MGGGGGMAPTLGGLGGGASSPGSSPTKPSHSHSAQASPTNTLRPWRPRARSADESSKKVCQSVTFFFVSKTIKTCNGDRCERQESQSRTGKSQPTKSLLAHESVQVPLEPSIEAIGTGLSLSRRSTSRTLPLPSFRLLRTKWPSFAKRGQNFYSFVCIIRH